MTDEPLASEAWVDLIDALGELTNPPLDGQGQYGAYPTLPGVLDHVRPVLRAHGFALMQEALTEGAFVGVNTRLVHRSGGSLTAGPLLIPAGQNAQTAGSALTYAARYAICRLLGIAGADEDDDASIARSGSGGSGSTTAPGSTKDRAAGPSPRPSGPPTSEAPASDRPGGEGPHTDEARAGLPADPNPPVLPVGGGVPDWKAIAQRLTRVWKRNVTMTDAQQAVIAELRSQDIGVKKPSDVNEDLANHAVRELERAPR